MVLRTTFGRMLANIPAVLLGNKIAAKLPVKIIRTTAAVVFAALGIATCCREIWNLRDYVS